MYDHPKIMLGKAERQDEIVALVRSGEAATQAQLRSLLRRRGHRVDQSTLSRDLAELGIRKSGGRYVAAVEETASSNGQAALAGAVRDWVPCGPHLIVVFTTTGQAQPVAVAIDRAIEPAILATLAGDDTIFLATRNRRQQAVAMRRLEQWFGVRSEGPAEAGGQIGAGVRNKNG
jgi:transcriptional regulator of arginine metabolism